MRKYGIYVVFIAHLISRQWPIGGTLQTVADVVAILAVTVALVQDLRRRKS